MWGGIRADGLRDFGHRAAEGLGKNQVQTGHHHGENQQNVNRDSAVSYSFPVDLYVRDLLARRRDWWSLNRHDAVAKISPRFEI